MTPLYTTLLFDADGTLFDYDRAETWALSETFAQYGHAFKPGYSDLYRRVNGPLWDALEQGDVTQDRLKVLRFELLFDQLGLAVDPAAFSASYSRQLGQGTFLIDGALETVAELNDDYRLFIITNGLTDVQRPRFGESSIGRYFEDWIISEEVGFAKPDPRIFDVAFERMGRPDKEQVLIIGDSLTSDIAGGIAYGIDTCWFNPAGRKADATTLITYEIQELSQLLTLPTRA
ncbi:MAG TPA: YjjG family noncanonical pyrimidine nucleotidase [Anaerolineae bacterium]|jgi:2-haloacid dehalogenase|nr:YjjG family noncanonical pyrimidine nucleotidase [Anaerolineae bacterium]